MLTEDRKTGHAGHVADHAHIARKLNNVLDLQADFGAVGDGVADDTDAIREWLRYAAWHHLYAPAGRYISTEPLVLRETTDVRIEGAGMDVVAFRIKGQVSAGLELDGVAGAEFSGFTVTTDPADAAASMDKGIFYHWDQAAAASRSSTNNRFTNVAVSGKFRVGVALGADGASNQEDQTYWYGCRLIGGWTPGETTWWQSGFQCGSGVFGNNLLHRFYGIDATFVRRGVHVRATDVALYGGILQSNEADIYLEGIGGFFYANGIRSEGSGRFLDTHGVVGYACEATLDCIEYRVPLDGSFPVDQQFIRWRYPGCLNLRSVSAVDGPAKIYAWAPNKVTVNADGLRLQGLSPAESLLGGAGRTVYNVRGYSQFSAGGEMVEHTHNATVTL